MNILDELLSNNFEPSAYEVDDVSKYKFVLYARRSTKDESRQVRSLGDQIQECKKYASQKGIKIVSIVREKQSAKDSGIRPKFRQVIESIEKGEIDGILAWHPDRLARNMKEAGEIIDLIDKGIIKSLQFPIYNFDGGPQGKLLLSIMFALSKNYSDNLSQNVKRGTKNAVLEGKTLNVAKHGYYRDSESRQHPDGANYDLICQAFEKRIEGDSLSSICTYLNNSSYTIARKLNGQGRAKVKFTEQMLSKMFSDPFYLGVFTYGDTTVKLTDIYDFRPAISVEQYKALNLERIQSPKREAQAKLLNGKVLCADCGSKMTSGLTVKKHKDGSMSRYYYYRCETDGCKRKNKSTRAKIIVNHAVTFFENFVVEDKNKFYKHYIEEVARLNKDNMRSLLSEEKSLLSKITHTKSSIKSIKETIRLTTDIDIKESYADDLKESLNSLKVLEAELKVVLDKKDALGNSKLTLEKLLELLENMPSEIQKDQPLERLDAILSKVFSNLKTDGKKIVSYQLEEPFNSMYQDGLFSLAGVRGCC